MNSPDLNELPDLNESLSDGEEINPNLHRDSFIRDQSKNAETGSEGDFYSSSSLSSREIDSSADEALGERKKPDPQSLVKAILDAIVANKKWLPEPFDSETGDKLKSIFKTMKLNKEIKSYEYLKCLSIIKNSSDPHSIQKRLKKREHWKNLRKSANEGDQHAKELIDRDNDRKRGYQKNLRKSANEGDRHAKELIDRYNAKKCEYQKNLRKSANKGDQHAKELIDRHNAKNREYRKNLSKNAKEGDQHAEELIDRHNARVREYWEKLRKKAS